MNPEYQRILALLRQPDTAVRFACRVGSRVYGTAGPGSDHDYLVVMVNPGQKQDLLFGKDVNVVVHGARTFQAALEDGGVFAFEAVFAPVEHRLKEARPPLSCRLDRRKLGESATARSKSDFDKARKCFEEEPGPSKKKLFHALRVPMFALQLARTGKITDFAQANGYHAAIMANESPDFADYEAKYGPLRTAFCDELKRLVGER